VNNYDFKSLSDFDFELLVRDLLQEELGFTLESFKPGKDGGIDLRYISDRDSTLIVQCKHYASSTISQLKSNLKKEVEKVERLKPTRYIIATSLGLTPKNKKDTSELFMAFYKISDIVYGNDDLNNLLGKYPHIEKKHYKLWLTSSAVLDKILHSTVYNQSDIDKDEIIQKSKLYVQTDAYFKARDILAQKRFCIITGMPGIGKTSLAEILLLRYMSNGFEVFKIYDMSDAYEVFNSNKNQLFYYDDFLGQTSFEDKLTKNEDEKILKFMNKISNSKKTFFILTTRDYILNQAKSAYEKLNDDNFDKGKYVLELEDIAKLSRAHILYNHIYFSDLDQEHIESITKNRNYLKILTHANYNPRIIQFMTTKKLDFDGQYIDCFLEYLDNPRKIWEHAFENQLSVPAKNLLLALLVLPDSVFYDYLKKSFDTYHEVKCSKFGIARSSNNFRKSLKELDGNFLSIIRDDNGVNIIKFHNPSIKDFLEQYVVDNPEEFEILCKSSVYFEQCVKIWDLVHKRAFSKGYSHFKYTPEFVEALINNLKSELKTPSTPFFSRLQMSEHDGSQKYENRLIFLIDIAEESNDKQFNGVVDNLANFVFSSLKLEKISKDSLISLTKKINDSKLEYAFPKDKFISKVKSYLFHDYCYLEDFEALERFTSLLPNKILEDEYSTLKNDFVDYCKYDAYDDISDFDSIETGVDTLESIATGLDLDISDLVGTILEKHYSDDYEPDHDDDSWRELRPEPNDEKIIDETIDYMFSGL
jgi:hypothetical protein